MVIAAFTEHKVASLSEFLKHVEREKQSQEDKGNKADFIFRGQSTDLPLLPKLAREGPLRVHANLEKHEQLMLKEFKRTSPGLTALNPVSEWDYLSLGQHHGLPTRLLDWTYGALPALWFAVERSPKKDKKGNPQNAVVWLLKTSPDNFVSREESESPFDNYITRIYRPRVIAQRISAQGGLFTVHQFRKTRSDFLPLERNPKYSKRLIKFIIDPDRFHEFKKHLNGCGVNRASLFPDLDGLCSHLAWRYFDVQ